MSPDSRIETVLVCGGGVMGNGLAHVAALGGYATLLYDAAPGAGEKALALIERNLQKGVERGKVEAGEKEAALSRLEIVPDLPAAAARAQFVIEAIPERIDLKAELFRSLDAHCPEGAVLATNTSALSITEIAAFTERPESVIGMHFFNPAHIMRLVEVIRGLETSERAVEATFEVARRMGKTPVRVNESPGFATSRVNALIGNEAFFMLQEGVASAEDIDTSLKLGLNHPMGPFELGDLVGLDTRLSVLRHLHRTLGEKFRPCPLLEKYVLAGRLGRKSGKGVYAYDEEGNRLPAPPPA
ncbi:MAG: 3-hydroxyacyl-CoA dehydrogenase NAD-binding domain-containing protein [bacterium]